MAVAPSPFDLRRRRIRPWPVSPLGRRAVLVAAGTLVWFVVLLVLALLGVPDWGWGARAALGATGLVAALAAVSSGVAAVVAIVRGERSIALALPLLLGVFWGMLLVGELRCQH